MSETPEHSAPTTPLAPAAQTHAPPPSRPSRLTQVAAWVGIVAGVVFVVAVIFGTGFMVGKNGNNTDGGRLERGQEAGMYNRGGPPPFPMGPRRDFERRPRFTPPGPDQQPTTTAPNTTPPARP